MATPVRTEEQGPAPGTTGATAPRPDAGPARTPAAGRPARAPGRLDLSGRITRIADARHTAPGRLRLAGAMLAVLTVAFGLLTAWQVDSRAQAADRVVSYSQPLSQAAADIHRSLADADTTAATGFLLAGAEPKAVRERYEKDLATASRLIAEAAARTTASSPAQQWLSSLNQQIPVYAGLVETARADNRLGFPLGGAYLRYASQQMRDTLLPDAAKLADAENEALARDYAEARAVPWAAFVLGLLTLVALVRVQQVLFRRTNRVFNIGLVGSTAAVLAAVLWLLAGSWITGARLDESERDGSAPLRALNTARVDVLTARLAENLHLVARGSSTQYADLWASTTKELTGIAGGDAAPGTGGALGEARRLAPRDAADAVDQARKEYTTWSARHAAAITKETVDGDYQGALDSTITVKEADVPNTSDASFSATDQQLERAAGIELARFKAAAGGTGGLLDALAAGAAVLALVAAASAVRGLGRRLAEYR
ncbi:hypothetical protein OG689_14195 [Kitasatospora sp. NBC_00240]|uniref:hypothetical protein n=1 Tax=Kitasatospora sp. NBC_00240 TaxID=2903567 RepID=UPI002255714B|nr:hypothetical protein [Kitasatospora sp. NBC_00240]MCX5210428.1 hypothetical protein [Kitasatospora sp. NBC_00240]